MELDAKLSQLDDQLQPLKPEGEEQTTTEEKPVIEAPSATEDGSAGEETDEGYTIDENDEEKPQEAIVEEPKQGSNTQYSPEQQYILDNLTPITVRGMVNGSDEVKEFKVLAPEQLPQGFKFIDERESAIANKAFATLETKAERLQVDFRTQQSAKSSQEFVEREKQADREDIGRLQRDKEIPRFKADPDSPEFDKDPGVQLVQDVLDFKDKRNDQYAKEYQAGRPYKHIGFEEAFRMYRHQNPDKVNDAQSKEDKARKDLARRTVSTTSGDVRTPEKPRAHSGMGSRDLDQLIEEKTQGW